MTNQHNGSWSRRGFLTTAVLGGAGVVLGWPSEPFAAEPPPETSRIRLIRSAVCQAPQYIADDLLRGEGFTDVQDIQKGRSIPPRIQALAAGEGDILSTYAGPVLARIDAGDPIVVISGLHAGCLELYATEKIRTVRDLKGKTVAVTEMRSGGHYFLASVMSYIGLKPDKDINWIAYPAKESIRLLAEGKIDAYMASPPDPHELRTRKIGHVIINSTTDRPWSQYFCCIVAANREFVRKNPVATKRALRAIMKSADICALEPERSARQVVEKGYGEYESTVGTLKEIPYGKWREYDPEDTIRFYSLRLNEIGMIRSSPQKIIAQGTDWRFLRELKKVLKT